MDLGQIFTTGNVASYMVNLFTIPKDARIIYPAIEKHLNAPLIHEPEV